MSIWDLNVDEERSDADNTLDGFSQSWDYKENINFKILVCIVLSMAIMIA